MSDGRRVVLSPHNYQTPSFCASCGGAPETSVETSRSQSRGRGSVTLRMRFPYCKQCGARAAGEAKRSLGLWGLAFLFSAGLAGGVWFAPDLPIGVVVGGVTAAAAVVTLIMLVALKPRMPAQPATAAGEAVKIKGFDHMVATLYCSNPRWADALAHANGSQATPGKDWSVFGLWAPVMAAVVAAGGGAILWSVSHPTIYVDNAFDSPVQIWVNGEPTIVVPADAHNELTVHHGAHEIGWSAEGKKRPAAIVEVDIEAGQDQLYNPGATSCYWLVLDVYGDASGEDAAWGPQGLREFHSFDQVDVWFGDNPQVVEVNENQSGTTQIALQRAKMCMQFAFCGPDARADLIKCQQKALGDDTAFQKCGDDAAKRCGEPPPGAETVALKDFDLSAPRGGSKKKKSKKKKRSKSKRESD